MNRRTFLSRGGISAIIGLSGCLQNRLMQETGEGGPQPEPTRHSKQFQYDARNTGSTSQSSLDRASERWKSTVPPISGGLSIANGRVIVAADGELIALDEDSGDKMWDVRVGQSTYSPPTLSGDTAYVTTWNGGSQQDRGVVAVDLEEGTELWRSISRVDVTSAPTLADGTLYVGGSVNSSDVIALDTTDGSEQWRFDAGRGTPTPAVADGTVYAAGGAEPIVYALDANSGEEEWRFETEDSVNTPPTFVDGTVYVGTGNGRFYSLDSSDGTEQWHIQADSAIVASAAATANSVYAPARERFLALESDGTSRWSIDTSAVEHGPTVTNDGVIVADGGGVFCLDAATGDQRWQEGVETRFLGDVAYTSIGCDPVVVDSGVYIASTGGYVYALDDEG